MHAFGMPAAQIQAGPSASPADFDGPSGSLLSPLPRHRYASIALRLILPRQRRFPMTERRTTSSGWASPGGACALNGVWGRAILMT
jgi:hypothetical protein